jgi:hypothetical protein
MRNAFRIVICSIVVLVPCFWQQRIQAGDLGSHIYNVWLAQLIERGQVSGLTLARQTNNILFDMILSGLWNLWGPGVAQRIAVSLAVLVFFWGAFAFLWSRQRAHPRAAPWHLAPWLAVLSYGWVFHMGFFNFYLSLGLCFGVLALARQGSYFAKTAIVVILAGAYLAHPLPVTWAVGVLSYERLARGMQPRHRIWLALGGLAATVAITVFFHYRFLIRWSPSQIPAFSGAEQVWVFGPRYFVLLPPILAIWTLWLRRLWKARGGWRIARDARFQVWLLCAAGVAIIPSTILLPGFRHSVSAFAERMSLANAVLFLGMASALRPRRAETVAATVIAAFFFSCLYYDERGLNRIETQMERLANQIPDRQRVVSVLADPASRVNSMAHLLDRACIARCYSYGNYEPSTAHFRVRADHPNPVVVWEYSQSWGIQAGGYRVEPRDLPLYKIDVCAPDQQTLCISTLNAGTTLRNTWLRATANIGKEHLDE